MPLPVCGGGVSSESEIIHYICHHSLSNLLGSGMILRPERWGVGRSLLGGRDRSLLALKERVRVPNELLSVGRKIWKQRLVVATKDIQVSCGELVLAQDYSLIQSILKFCKSSDPTVSLTASQYVPPPPPRLMVILTNMIFKYCIMMCDNIGKMCTAQWSDIFQISNAWYHYVHSKCKVDQYWF